MHVDVLSGGISFVDHYYYFPIRNYHTLNPYYRSRKVAVVSVTFVNAKDLFFFMFFNFGCYNQKVLSIQE